MNKKGFTLVELITTFALTATIVIILMNVIVIIKNLYSSSSIKTTLLINQANLSNVLNSKIADNKLISCTECEDSEHCFEFGFAEGENTKLIVTDTKITFGNYVYKLEDGSTIGNFTVTKEPNVDITDTTVNNSFLIIKIPITHKQYPNQDFGVNLIYQYNSNYITLEL